MKTDFLNHPTYPHYVVVALYAHYWRRELGLTDEQAERGLREAAHTMTQELTDESKEMIKDVIKRSYIYQNKDI